ncbi:putative membrane protein [Paraburkholderia sp. GAS199]|uniref:DUF969 domain-containing protein n=1 Tax=Paraburkholderia sp. GAS199 TaxID=3035126 RepID=UPI003D1F5890
MISAYLPLVGVVIMVATFLVGLNPLAGAAIAAVVTGVIGHMTIVEILTVVGQSFIKTRNLPLIILLPVVVFGLLERHGLKEFSYASIKRIRTATVGRLLIVYLLLREVSAAIGLTSLGGQVQMVRPIVAPMAEGVAEMQAGCLSNEELREIRGYAASADNVGLFFGEDIFVAFGAIALMHTILLEEHIAVDPLHIAFWGIPTAVAAFVIHSIRLGWYSTRISKRRVGENSFPATHMPIAEEKQ